jgi:transposase InsO family protein
VSKRREHADAAVVSFIREIQTGHGRRYGSLRVRETLVREYGKGVSRKEVAPLMRENGLNARRRRKVIPTTHSNHGRPVCEHSLNRRFHTEKGGTHGVSDITYLRTSGTWVYLTVVDRKVSGWA